MFPLFVCSNTVVIDLFFCKGFTMFSWASSAVFTIPAASTASAPQQDLVCFLKLPVDFASFLSRYL